MHNGLIRYQSRGVAWLEAKQGDVTAVFLHADVVESEKSYVDMRKSFE